MRITHKMIKESVDAMGITFTCNELIRWIFKEYFCYDFDLYLKEIKKEYLRDINEKMMDSVLKTFRMIRRSVFEMKSYGDVVITNYTFTKVTFNKSEHD